MSQEIYLIPSNLSQDSFSTLFLGNYYQDLLKEIDVFWVENVRSARRFISACKTERKIEEIIFETLDKDTSNYQIEGYFKKYARQKIGILSEAGCPGIADPGAVAVAIAHQKKVKVIPMVGPSSIVLALMGSGFNGQSFSFHGYLPIEIKEKNKILQKIENDSYRLNQTQLFIETPYRNNKLLKDILATCNPNTQLCIAADITGQNELIQSKSINEWKKNQPDLHKIQTIFLI